MRSALASILLLFIVAAWADDEKVVPSETESAGPVTETEEGLTFGDLFRMSEISLARLSPNGELVAFFRYNTLVIGNGEIGYSDVREFNDRLTITSLSWIGPNTIWVRSSDPEYDRYVGSAIRFKRVEDSGVELRKVEDHFNYGYVSDRLPNDDEKVIIARPEYKDDVLFAELYTIRVFEPLDPQLIESFKVDTGSGDFFYYRKNAAGEYVLGIRIVESVPEIWVRMPGSEEWEAIWTSGRESEFSPSELSPDGKTLWVLSNEKTDRVAAMEFDLEKKEFGEILFQHERVDVEDILMSEDGSEPIGVVYADRGLYRYHFFNDEDDAEFEKLQAQFPTQEIYFAGYSQESGVKLVVAASPTERGSIHMCDVTNTQCELVASVAPWLDGKQLSETIAMDVPSTDGIVVEAFLTLPLGETADIPLIALPHGGPIGISDDRYFSSEVQWLALNGYAVLQVNYRGSGGYGETFRNAGLRQWGRGIEDDIEAAVAKVLSDYPEIDGDRVGIFGASYGGYSALMSIVRNPERFKCAASFAGVTDLTLLFKRADVVRDDGLRELLVKYVGDPNIDYEEQVENSPVYRYKEIGRPVLIAHGLNDSIVDFEHSWRMQKMLRLAGKPPKFILLKDIGHGFDYVDDARKLYEPLLEFLDTYLKPESTPQAPSHAETGLP